MNMYTVNDFFCGAGGMGLGFKQAGYTLTGSWDIDKHAVTSYKANISEDVIQSNIAEMTWEDVPHASVWTFGFPCTDISIAGKKAGMIKGETRSGLFYEIMRLLDETQEHDPKRLPRILLAENVKAVKAYLPEIEKEYKARGYQMQSALLNSKFWGVPHQRERYFIVGVHESVKQSFQFPVQQTDNIPLLSSILEKEVDEKYIMDDVRQEAVLAQAKKGANIIGTHACLTPARVKRRQNGRRAKEHEDVMYTLTAQDYHGVIEKKEGSFIVRRLTPREYARLQGFPESFSIVVSDNQLYKQMGNAVSVPVSKALAEAIKPCLA